VLNGSCGEQISARDLQIGERQSRLTARQHYFNERHSYKTTCGEPIVSLIPLPGNIKVLKCSLHCNYSPQRLIDKELLRKKSPVPDCFDHIPTIVIIRAICGFLYLSHLRLLREKKRDHSRW
jgi:hypothetical protein